MCISVGLTVGCAVHVAGAYADKSGGEWGMVDSAELDSLVLVFPEELEMSELPPEAVDMRGGTVIR